MLQGPKPVGLTQIKLIAIVIRDKREEMAEEIAVKGSGFARASSEKS